MSDDRHGPEAPLPARDAEPPSPPPAPPPKPPLTHGIAIAATILALLGIGALCAAVIDRGSSGDKANAAPTAVIDVQHTTNVKATSTTVRPAPSTVTVKQQVTVEAPVRTVTSPADAGADATTRSPTTTSP